MHRRGSRPSIVFALAATVLAVLAGFPALSGAAVAPQVFAVGSGPFFGDLRNVNLNSDIVDFAATPTGNGYWQVAKDGGVFTFGDAQYYGSTGDRRLNQPVVAMAAATNGQGYYFLARDGGIFTFGNTSFFGSSGSLGGEWVDMAVDPDGNGYWVLGASGAVYSSTGTTAFANGPTPPSGVKAVGLAATPSGDGLWIAYSNGTVAEVGAATNFDLADSAAFGTTPVVDIARTADGDGVWLVGSTGQVEAIGGATPGDDAVGGNTVVAVVGHPSGDGYWVATEGPSPGSISGRVLDDAGNPVAGLCVSTTSGPTTVTVTTDVNGNYTLSQVRAGQYRVRFASCPQENYLPEYYRDTDSFTSATVVSVTFDQDVVLDDATVTRGATLSGVVRGADGLPLQRACVGAYNGSQPGGPSGFGQTSVTGYYKLAPLRAATYQVNFSDCNNANHVSEWYDDAETQALATPVVLALGDDATANAQLAPAGAISGAVTTDDAGALPANLCVGAYLDGEIVRSAIVQTGAYKIKGLRGGSYQVHFNDCTNFQSNDYVDEWWNDQPARATAAPVDVTLGVETPSVNASLARGATISGRMTAAVGGGGVAFACVDAIQSSTVVSRGFTAVSGTYSIRGLRAGSYSVRFSQCDIGGSLAREYWQDSATAPGTLVTVALGETRTGIDASLDPGGKLEGTVTDASGNPVVVCVDAWDGVGSMASGISKFNGVTGQYQLGGFNSTDYKLRFRDCTNTDNHLGTEWFENSATRSDATPVTAVAGATVTVPTAVLNPEGVISGVVTDDFGRLVQGICVRPILPDGTDASFSTVFTTVTGFYRVPHLAAGSYKVKFDDCNRQGYVGEWWDDTDEAGADQVTVVAGQTIGSINAQLAVRGASSVVTDVAATGGDRSADVSWTRSTATSVVGYRIVTNPGGSFIDVGPTASSAHIDGLTNGQSYTFLVRTRHSFGIDAGATSNAVTPAGVPGAPGKPTATAGDGSASLSWSASDPNGAPLTGYTITASPGGATTNVGGSATSATVTGLSNGTTYTFTVTATNAVGTGVSSPASDPVTPAGVPGAPGKPTATAGDGSASLSWSAANPNGAPLTGYTITASPGGATTNVGGSATSATVTGLSNGTAYTFTVTATNAVGTGAPSPASDPVTPVTPAAAPGPPGQPVAVPGDGSVALSWTGAAANGSPITGYRVTASPGGAEITVAASVTTVTFGGLTNGTAYTFTVRAINAVGAGVASPPSAAATPFGPPANVPAVELGSGGDNVLPTGTDLVLSGDGYAPFSPGTLVINSTPLQLGTFVADATGHFVVVVKIPAGFEPGVHTIVATGTAPGGAVLQQATSVVVVAAAPAAGYRLLGADGGVFAFGDAGYIDSFGDASRLMAGGASTPNGKGYWMTTIEGLVFTAGEAVNYGSLAGSKPNKPIVGMATTLTGKGYWLVASDGGIFSFGDAAFFGSTGAMVLNKPIVGMATTPTGKGYWLVASDGGIFSFGDAAFFGSTGAMVLNKPIVGMSTSPTGKGYRLVASDGGIFTFGDAKFFGSTGAMVLNKPIVGMLGSPTGLGYRLVASDGGIFTFGDATYLGSTGGITLNKPVIALF